jgi:hypothetical protein
MTRTATKPAAPATETEATINTARPPASARPKGWAAAEVQPVTRTDTSLPVMGAWLHPSGRLAVHRLTYEGNVRGYIAVGIINGKAWRIGEGTAAEVRAWAARAEAALAELTEDVWRDLDAASAADREGWPSRARSWPDFAQVMQNHYATHV